MTCSRSCISYVAELGTEHPYRTRAAQKHPAEDRAGVRRGMDGSKSSIFLSYLVLSGLQVTLVCSMWNPVP